MVQLTLLLFAVLIHAASSKIAGREGFVVQNKKWEEVVGKSEEEAKEFIRRELPNAKFLTVPEDTYQSIPSVLHLNQVLLGVSSSGEVKHPAKYFGYVPDFTFAEDSVGKSYAEVVESIKTHLPSCKIVVVRNGETVFSCCQQVYDDHVRLEVDDDGLLLHLPVFVPNILENEDEM